MKKLWIAGGGGHCRSVLDTVIDLCEYDEIVVTDPSVRIGTYIIGNVMNIGNDNEACQIIQKWRDAGVEYGVHVAVGGIKELYRRKELVQRISNICSNYYTIIDKSAVVSPYSTLLNGVFVGKQSVVNAGAYVGSYSIINTGAIIEHDCHVGAYSHVSVGVKVCGGVNIGDYCFIGAGATIIQGVKIGDCSIIGAGSIVLRDIMPNEKVFGIVKESDHNG